MSNTQPFELIQEHKPTNPCVVHERELLIDLYNQAKNSPAGPWKMDQGQSIIVFTCTLCGCKRTYKQSTEKTLL